MPVPAPTADELFAVLSRSSLPTVVVEGRQDAMIYRWLESLLSGVRADFLPCNCRETVLALFQRRGELAGKQTVFMADQDMWALTSIPPEYSDVLFTSGYSIENDVLATRAAERLFDAKEKAAFTTLLLSLEEWFAFEVDEYQKGRPYFIDLGVDAFVGKDMTLSTEYVDRRGYAPVRGAVREKIAGDSRLLIRGKTLLGAYSKILNEPGRAAKYPKWSIMEMCIKFSDPHVHCDRLVEEIRSRLGRK